MRQLQLLACLRARLTVGRGMGISPQSAIAEKTSHCRPSQHFSRTAQKVAACLQSGPLPLQFWRDRKIHHAKTLLGVGTKRMLFHSVALNYFVIVSSRFNISLATMVHAASSGAGIDGSLFFSPVPIRS